jgi:hypothetical protein
MTNQPPNQLTEEFIRMQKIAGIINEAEYQSLSREIGLKDLSEKISRKCDLIKQSLKDQGYEI